VTAWATHRARLERAADWLAAAAAASLPWSTSATSILVGVWLAVLLPTLDWPRLRRELFSPAGGLPVLLALLAIIGMAWADVGWGERLHGFRSFLKLLLIPLLLVQFRRSDKGLWVLAAFLISCAVLLAASYGSAVAYPRGDKSWGVPVKSYIPQSVAFSICAFVAIRLGMDAAQAARPRWAAALFLLAAAFLANIFFVAAGRTALVMVAALVVLFGLRHFGRRGVVAALLVGAVAAAALWAASPYLRDRVSNIWTEVERYRTQDQDTSAGYRLEFWKKSVEIMRGAPLVGHGTGSIRQQFERLAVGETGMAATVTPNPHNQTLAIGVQLGLLGIAVLYAMWGAHLLLLFRGAGIAAWFGTVVVVQNVVGSLFNSHLFDFTEGWIYVLLVGSAAGIVRQGREDRYPFRRHTAAEPVRTGT
jgi:O-antigen ligase